MWRDCGHSVHRAFIATRTSPSARAFAGLTPCVLELRAFVAVECIGRFARAAFGRVLLKACLAEEKETPSAARLETERTRLLRAPTVIAVISRVTPNPGAPEWEQVLSCGAACFNMCLAANALGFGTCWITEWYAYSQGVRSALGLAANERVAGFVYIGTAKEQQPDRDRPQLAKIVTRWTG